MVSTLVFPLISVDPGGIDEGAAGIQRHEFSVQCDTRIG